MRWTSAMVAKNSDLIREYFVICGYGSSFAEGS